MLACSLLTINTTTMPSVHDTLSQDTTSVSDALWAMVDKELNTTYRSVVNYLENTPSSSSGAITSSDRMKIVDWCYSIIDNCSFDRETVAMVSK